MRTFCHCTTPLGLPCPFMPGAKSRLETILCVVWMSYTQCPAVSTWRVPISVPVHSNALQSHASPVRPAVPHHACTRLGDWSQA